MRGISHGSVCLLRILTFSAYDGIDIGSLGRGVSISRSRAPSRVDGCGVGRLTVYRQWGHAAAAGWSRNVEDDDGGFPGRHGRWSLSRDRLSR